MKTVLILLTYLTCLFGESKTLDVGVYENPPKIFWNQEHKPDGFFVHLLDEIASQEGWKLNYVSCEWEECLQRLERGEIDLMPDVAYSREREKQYRFNDEIVLSTWSVIYTSNRQTIRSILDLDRKKIAILSGSIQHQQIRESFQLFEIQPEIVLTQSFDEAFELLRSGKVDGAIVNRYYGALNASQYGVKATTLMLNPAAIKFAFPPNDESHDLMVAIDKHLKAFKNDPDSVYYQAMEEHLIPTEIPELPEWLNIAIMITAVIIAILGITVVVFQRLLAKRTRSVIESSAKLKELEHEKVEAYQKMVKALIGMIEQRDSYTAGHSERVAGYSLMIAREMGYDEEDCLLIAQAATLHDIGKIATPDAILLKPDRLNDIEYELIKEHVRVGVKILQDIPMFQHMAQIIRYHHERYDGNGYPDGIGGDDIPPLARIMMVADAFDAMTTNRIYKHKKEIPEALAELVSLKGSHYHPEVVDAAIRVLGNISISADVNQNPITAIEKHRFAYFYRDAVSGLYNEKYLETALSEDRRHVLYPKVVVIALHRFDLYNQRHGWEQGNELLRLFALVLSEFFADALIFRIHANDFVLLLPSDSTYESYKQEIATFVHGRELSYDWYCFDRTQTPIDSYRDLIRVLKV